MFTRHFFTSKLGIAALVSVAMMVTFALSAPTLVSVSGAPVDHRAGAQDMGLPLLVLA